MPGNDDPREPGARGRLVREAVAVFHDAEIMETAIDELLSSGFDRAEISLLAGEQVVEERLGHRFDDVRELEDDPAAPRRAFVPTAAIGEAEGAAIGALMFVGAVSAVGAVVASGGTLGAAITAAAAAGGGSGAVGAVLGKLIERRRARGLQAQLERGGLLLWVNLRDQAHERRAIEILKRYGAEDVHVHELPAEA